MNLAIRVCTIVFPFHHCTPTKQASSHSPTHAVLAFIDLCHTMPWRARGHRYCHWRHYILRQDITFYNIHTHRYIIDIRWDIPHFINVDTFPFCHVMKVNVTVSAHIARFKVTCNGWRRVRFCNWKIQFYQVAANILLEILIWCDGWWFILFFLISIERAFDCNFS